MSKLAADTDNIFIGELEAEIERLRDALQFIVDGYPNPNISHLDFRVGAYQAALSVLDLPFSGLSPASAARNSSEVVPAQTVELEPDAGGAWRCDRVTSEVQS